MRAAASSAKVSDQLCAILGGGCKAPLSDEQLSSAANKLAPDQKSALSDNFNSTLNSLASNPAVRESVTKAIGAKLGGWAVSCRRRRTTNTTCFSRTIAKENRHV